MSFEPIRIVGLDHTVSVVHPITGSRSDELITLHFKLSAIIPEGWEKHFEKAWTDSMGATHYKVRTAKAFGNTLTIESSMDKVKVQISEDLRRLTEEVNNTNLAYQNKEVKEEKRQERHRATIYELAGKLGFD